MSKKKPLKSDNRCEVRIIAGQWRGRKLRFEQSKDNTDLRPTGDRIRETVFNWLMPYLVNARCLDLFAGTGALGWEALSRHAEHCVLVEKESKAHKQLREHQQQLQAQSMSELFHSDAMQWLVQKQSSQFDIVFIDAPFRFKSMPQECIDVLIEKNWLADNAMIYVELDAADTFPSHPSLETVRHKCTSQVQYGILQLIERIT